MAYTITQKPTTPNAAYTRLLYVVSGSTNTTKPQFQYVMDVYESGSTDLIKRTTQTINPAGVAVFDPSRIMQGQLSDDYSWKISSVTPFNSSSKTFRLEFGESYAASISSSAGVIDNIARTTTEVFSGIVEPNAGAFNWQSGSYTVLSNMPATMSMQSDDFGTIGVYNNDVSYISQSFYSASQQGILLLETKAYSVTDNFSSIPISASTPYWNYAEVNVSSSIGLQSYRYEVSDETTREKVRFAFINKLGSWDYYNNYNPVRQNFSVSRQQYTAPRVDYSSLTSTYDISRRGRTVNNSSTEDRFTVDTAFLTKTDANWIEELIESPSVYIQRSGEFIPIVITDSSYVAKTSTGRQKIFKYTINFKPSNQPFGKWEPEFVTCPSVTPLGTFDPYAGGTISSASLLHWYDFSDSSTMVLKDTNKIHSIVSKGFYTASLTTGSQTLTPKYSNLWVAPTFETQAASGNKPSYYYTQFYGTPDSTNSTLASAYGDFGSGSILPGFSGSDNTTTIYFSFVDLDEIGNNDNLITYISPGTHEGGFKDYKILSTRNKVPIEGNFDPIFYSANTASVRNVGSEMQFKDHGISTGSMYSYSGSNNNWQSTYIKISGSSTDPLGGSFDSSGSISSSRAIGETIASWESIFDLGPVNEGEGLSVGGNAETNDSDSAPFKLTSLLVYTGSLTDSQINSIINSYKSSVPFGDEINSISN